MELLCRRCFLIGLFVPQAAGNAVKRASDNLVKAAQKAAFEAQDDQAVIVKSKMVGGIAQVNNQHPSFPINTNAKSFFVIVFYIKSSYTLTFLCAF